MCDTMGEVRRGRTALFAKNSDRSPNEPQVTEWHAARDYKEKTVRTTYIEIEQVPHTHAFVLSRPVWLWGGEMGVNEHGVCIGNEAVFTKGPYGKTGLTGMDLLRLGLERGDSAAAARDVILEQLARYGQGGDCGYDHKFFYDNSFLILDRDGLFILETSGKDWVWKEQERGSISNRLSIGYEGDVYSGGHKVDFKARNLEPLYSHFSGSKKRMAQTAACIERQPDLAGMFSGLREHQPGMEHPLTRPSVSSPCMHAGGLVGDHTTASMVVSVGEHIDIWLTGSSTPCISLFKPYRFGNPPAGPVVAAGDRDADSYWRRQEQFHRAAVGQVLPDEFYAERDALEAAWMTQSKGASDAAMQALTVKATEDDAKFYHKWVQALAAEKKGSRRFFSYWQKKTAELESPARPARMD